MKLAFLEIDTGNRWALSSAGPGFIAAFLRRHGHHSVSMRIAPEDKPRDITRRLERVSPDLLCLSLTSSQWLRAAELSPALRAELCLPSVAGGLFPTFAPEVVLASGGFDHVCIGEGEQAMLELVTCLDEGGVPAEHSIDKIWSAGGPRPGLRPPPADIDTLPFVDRRFLGEENGVVHMFTQRGCPFSCAYCAGGAIGDLFGKGFVRRRSVENVLRELAALREEGPVNYVIFLDDTFTHRPAWVASFCEAYGKGFNVPFSIQARVDTVTPAMLRQLAEAGCHHMTFGVESGSPEIRRRILNRPMSDERIAEAFAMAREAGIMVTANYMIGLPHERAADIEMTLALNERIDPDDFGWAVFYPFPGTALFDLCGAEGFLPENWAELPARHDRSILAMPQLGKEEIRRYHERFAAVRRERYIERFGLPPEEDRRS